MTDTECRIGVPPTPCPDYEIAVIHNCPDCNHSILWPPGQQQLCGVCGAEMREGDEPDDEPDSC